MLVTRSSISTWHDTFHNQTYLQGTQCRWNEWFVRLLFFVSDVKWCDLFWMMNKIFRNSRRNSPIQLFLFTILQSQFLRHITLFEKHNFLFQTCRISKKCQTLFDWLCLIWVSTIIFHVVRICPSSIASDERLTQNRSQLILVTSRNKTSAVIKWFAKRSFRQIFPIFIHLLHDIPTCNLYMKDPKWRLKSEPMQVQPHLFQPLQQPMPIRLNPNYLTKSKAVPRKFLQLYSFQIKMGSLVLVPIGKYSALNSNIPFYKCGNWRIILKVIFYVKSILV